VKFKGTAATTAGNTEKSDSKAKKQYIAAEPISKSVNVDD
jgi:hypothetical protein